MRAMAGVTARVVCVCVCVGVRGGGEGRRGCVTRVDFLAEHY